MPPHHFRVHLFDPVFDVELAALSRDACEESNLEKQIAKFFAQIVRPPLPRFFQRVEGLVSLFEQHWRQRRVSLFAIPWTTAGRAQAVHQSHQVSERLGHVESKVPSPGFKVKRKGLCLRRTSRSQYRER